MTGYPGTFCQHVTDIKPRCINCQKPIAWEITRPWKLQCRHCRVTNRSPYAPKGRIISSRE